MFTAFRTNRLFRTATWMLLFGAITHAQPALSQASADLIASWLVSVEGEARNRILRVQGAEQKADGTIVLDAKFGFADGNPGAASAEVIQSAEGRKLTLSNAAGVVIVATQSTDGVFSGNITYKSGVVKPVKLTRTAESELTGTNARRGNSAGSAFLQKEDVQKLVAGKVLTLKNTSDGQVYKWDIRNDGSLYANNLTKGNTDSAKWELNDSAGLCLSWRGQSANGCRFISRQGEKYFVHLSEKSKPYLEVVSIE